MLATMHRQTHCQQRQVWGTAISRLSFDGLFVVQLNKKEHTVLLGVLGPAFLDPRHLDLRSKHLTIIYSTKYQPTELKP